MKYFYTKISTALTCFFALALIFIFTENAMSAPYETKLENGLNIVYQKVPGVKVVSVQAWIRTGSVNETPEIAGISHFLEHILFKGTKKFKPGEIDEYLDSKGGSNNAFTSMDVTNYYVTIPVYEAEAAFEVVSDMVFDALFIAEEIEKEKPVVLQEIKRKYDDPMYLMWEDIQKQLMGGTPYERPVIGYPETVNALDRDKLLAYYNKYYHPQNMTLVIVGDIERDEALKLAKKYFSKTRDVAPGKMYDGKNKPSFTKPLEKSFEADINAEYAFFGYPADRQTLKTVFADEVMLEILSGGEYSLLNEELRNKNVVIYADDVAMFNKYNGFFGVVAEYLPGSGEKFMKSTQKILADIKAGKIDDARIEKAKNRLVAKMLFQEENVSSLAYDLGFAYVLDFKDYYLGYEQGVSAVSKKDVAEAANRLTTGAMYYGKTVPKK